MLPILRESSCDLCESLALSSLKTTNLLFLPDCRSVLVRMATSSYDDYDAVATSMESQCQEKWQRLQATCTTLQEKRTTQAIENENDLSTIYKAKEKLLKSQIKLLESSNETFPTDKVVHREMLLEELTNSVKQLEESKALSHTLYMEAVAELDKEKQLNKQHKAIKSTLQEKLADAPQGANQQDDNAIIRETTKQLQFLQKYNHSLLEKMALFMKKTFPPPNADQTKQWLKKQGLRADEDVVPFQSLQLILEDLMNHCIDTPHDPYTELDPKLHWQPYIQLLLRCGIALRHPDDESKIKLTPFHL